MSESEKLLEIYSGYSEIPTKKDGDTISVPGEKTGRNLILNHSKLNQVSV